MTYVKCPSCGGDGKETCNNPDHGFLSAMSFRGANESRCPCCGWDPNHKVRKYKNGEWFYPHCEVCNGKGQMESKEAELWADENGYEDELIEI